MIEADRLQLSLQHQSLQVALDGSRLLLHRKHLSLAPVDLNAPTFLWNSAAVFERFVGRLLSQIFADDPESFVIRDSALLGQRSGCDGRVASALTTLPDYRIVHKGRTLIVLDAKYKLLGARYKPRNQDVYQVMAGGRVHNCAHVALVYPIEAGINRAPLTWFFEGGGMPTHLTAVFLPLELMALPDGFTILCRLLEKDIPLIRS
jgi:5-methylcytosine-specific restriction endonuclease McrBC regulatory subunit McrC